MLASEDVEEEEWREHRDGVEVHDEDEEDDEKEEDVVDEDEDGEDDEDGDGSVFTCVSGVEVRTRRHSAADPEASSVVTCGSGPDREPDSDESSPELGFELAKSDEWDSGIVGLGVSGEDG